MIRVFYDGKCGLCRREINHYIRIAPAGVFEWVDITVNPDPFTVLGYSLSDGLKALHVQAASGTMYTGVDAFIVIWRQMPRWRLLATFASLPLIHPTARIAYRIFAEWRFKRLGYGQCALDKSKS